MALQGDDVTSAQTRSAEQGRPQRKAWSTPQVIVSEIKETQAHVTANPPDGMTSGVKYGS